MLAGDSKEVAALRCLLAQTRIEKKPLVLAYDAGAWFLDSILGFQQTRANLTGCDRTLHLSSFTNDTPCTVKDGWKSADFHRKVDNKGAALLVARTRGGAVCGGYNPEGA